MVTLKKITHYNLADCLYMEIYEEQKNFVDSNAESLAEAYARITNGGFATPYAIYDGEVNGGLSTSI